MNYKAILLEKINKLLNRELSVAEFRKEYYDFYLPPDKLTLDPDKFIKEAFGKDAQGRFFGNGRYMAGGLNDNSDYAKLKREVYDTQIKQKLLRLVYPDDSVIQTD